MVLEKEAGIGVTRMAKRTLSSGKHESPTAGWFAHVATLIAFLVSAVAAGFVWLVPIEVFEQWAFDRAGQGTFDKFEAVGEADFFVWMWRIVAPVIAILIGLVWSNLAGWKGFAESLWTGLISVTRFGSNTTRPHLLVDRIRTAFCRGLLLAWGLVFIGHSLHGIGLRAHDWPYFKFNSGDVVLPNISESNRAVIRYLQEATPATARILVASDQKLFFLSYYLRPRTLLHRMHPESEHVIPLKDKLRKLAAYRLDELTAENLAEMPHDYTLEYFEHPDLVDPSLVLRDPAWVAFIRKRERNPSLTPSYFVRLRKAGER